MWLSEKFFFFKLRYNSTECPARAGSNFLQDSCKREILTRYLYHPFYWGFPGGTGGKESVYNVGDQGLIPGSEASPGVREWQPTLRFLPGEFHG